MYATLKKEGIHFVFVCIRQSRQDFLGCRIMSSKASHHNKRYELTSTITVY